MKLYATYGRTESGDDLPVILWDRKPTEEEGQKAYAALLPGEEGLEVYFSVDQVDLPESIQEDLRMLRALENAGVDNWAGFDFAMEELYGDGEF